MRVVIIGGTGHIGTYLSPALVEAGHDVVCVCRGQRQPYSPHTAWSDIEMVTIDRSAPEFEDRIAQLNGEAVVDITCYTPESCARLVERLRGQVGHFLH